MIRPLRVLLISSASVAAAAAIAACGTEKIQIPKTSPDREGAVLFSQRCSGCHTLSYAATHGSAANVRTREAINGPDFNVRCERPVIRVLYAIQNGGFSGAYMPQNIVVGRQARQVANFVAKYAGRQASYQPGSGTPPCIQQVIGTLPPPGTGATATAAAAVTPTTTAPVAATAPAKAKVAAAAKNRKK